MAQFFLYVKVCEAQGLSSREFFGRPDPHVVVTFNNASDQTPVKKNAGEAPSWSSEFSFPCNPATVSTTSVFFSVNDDDKKMGITSVPASSLNPSTTFDQWLALTTTEGKATGGKLHVVLRIIPRPNINLISASYGKDNRTKDVTEKVRRALDTTGGIKINNDVFGGDPAHGVKKELVLHYQVPGTALTNLRFSMLEHYTLTVAAIADDLHRHQGPGQQHPPYPQQPPQQQPPPPYPPQQQMPPAIAYPPSAPPANYAPPPQQYQQPPPPPQQQQQYQQPPPPQQQQQYQQPPPPQQYQQPPPPQQYQQPPPPPQQYQQPPPPQQYQQPPPPQQQQQQAYKPTPPPSFAAPPPSSAPPPPSSAPSSSSQQGMSTAAKVGLAGAGGAIAGALIANALNNSNSHHSNSSHGHGHSHHHHPPPPPPHHGHHSHHDHRRH